MGTNAPMILGTNAPMILGANVSRILGTNAITLTLTLILTSTLTVNLKWGGGKIRKGNIRGKWIWPVGPNLGGGSAGTPALIIHLKIPPLQGFHFTPANGEFRRR